MISFEIDHYLPTVAGKDFMGGFGCIKTDPYGSLPRPCLPRRPRTSPTTDLAISSLRHAGMDCRHPGSQDASGDILVNLGSSTPCWNDEIEGSAWTDQGPSSAILSGVCARRVSLSYTPNFVLFATFVVMCLFPFRLRPRAVMTRRRNQGRRASRHQPRQRQSLTVHPG